jgi:spore germination protein GerM
MAAMLAACGVPHDAQPTVLPGGVVTPVLAAGNGEREAPQPAGVPRHQAAVYLVEAEHLVRVFRTAEPTDLNAVMSLLLRGATGEEFAAGLRSAVSPQTVLLSARIDGDTAVVDLSGAFVEVGGQEQIFAVAQIVLTAAAVPGVAQVRFLLDGQAVEIPRADGTLTSETLRTADYQRLLSPSG